MGKSASAAFSMMRLVLAISALASLASADLCFDGMEVAAACTAGTGLGERLMSALYTCDYTTYAKKSAGEGQDEDWHEALARRGRLPPVERRHGPVLVQHDQRRLRLLR